MSTAIVTGASSGLGAAIAQELARRQRHLVLVARRTDRLEALATRLRQQDGVKVHVLAADLTVPAQREQVVRQAADWARSQGETLSILVNNAGAGVWEDFVRQEAATLQRDIDLDIAALTHLCHDFVRLALQQGGPTHVLNIASLAGLLPAPRFAVYSAAKSYVIAFSEVLAYELKGSEVSVTCVCPGGVQTEFLALAGQQQISNIGMMQPGEVARQAVVAMLARKLVFVPGWLNKFSATTRYLPSVLRSWLVARGMALTVKPF